MKIWEDEKVNYEKRKTISRLEVEVHSKTVSNKRRWEVYDIEYVHSYVMKKTG